MTEDQLRILLRDVSAVQLILWALAFIAMMGFLVRLWPWLVRFITVVNSLQDLPAKLALVDDIHHEVHPNTGTSLNDAVRRVEAVQHKLWLQLNRQNEKLAEQSEKLTGLQELMESGDAELNLRVDDIEKALTPRKDQNVDKTVLDERD